MFTKVLVANRGEIARRIIRTLRRMNIISVAIYSEADRTAPHVLEADESVCIGPPAAVESYLAADKIIEAAVNSGAGAIHPGYGFLSENSVFAEKCEAHGIVFIGPTPAHLEDFGLKHTAREIASSSGVPLPPGSGLLSGLPEALETALKIGYPVMLKSTAGGGGIGMAVCSDSEELASSFDRIVRLSANNFSDSGIFLEKYIEKARHVEVQIFGDGKGSAVVLGDRDCSLQRRNQKVVEETPAPGIPDNIRKALHSAALTLAKSCSYRSAGTVEFVYDSEAEAFYFLEVNTRLQVEHTVTEETFGVDLVEWMVLLAAGEMDPVENITLTQKGAAIQVRLYSEDPAKEFQPTGGLLTFVKFPDGCRVDGWIETGTEITSYYDPLLAKLIVKGETREQVIESMTGILDAAAVDGIETNLHYLRQVFRLENFIQGNLHTKLLNSVAYKSKGIDVLAPGTAASIQDYPGRTGYWQVGVPPSGPMDSYSFRLGNRILGNSENAAGLEITHSGPSLKFRSGATVCIAGADVPAFLNGIRTPMWTPVRINEGDTLTMGPLQGPGQRSYLLIKGGFDVPEYLGSRSTFTLGVFGGHGGRNIRTGDVLRYYGSSELGEEIPCSHIPREVLPRLTKEWNIGVIYGPHGAPDFFTDEYMATFFDTEWEVHYNSDRTGIRLIGPTPGWARSDGGEAGLHPSNIHDNAYMIGAVDFTGDMPVILGPDGPSLGGFVCPVTIAAAEQWKMGQLCPGDTVRFTAFSERYARDLLLYQERVLDTLALPGKRPAEDTAREIAETAPVLAVYPKSGERPETVCRRSGETAVLVELGDPVLDIAVRFRIHAFMLHLESLNIEGIVEMIPGIRSLQIQFDPLTVDSRSLLEVVDTALSAIDGCENASIPSRIVYLPLSWDDKATRLAIEKYMTTVRPGAPWCPSNIEFIRRINGLSSAEDVKNILFSAEYLVMGLGDVYLGAPVATPVDPRHRLVTTKYNPARTWTPENAVGIGGAYLCVYGMEGPGGYQFVGRTLQMWNRFHSTEFFEPGKPWLLRFFDRIRFFPVSHNELMDNRRDFLKGRYDLKVEESEFTLSEYYRILEKNEEDIDVFRNRQQAAFNEEREEWERTGQAHFSSEPPVRGNDSLREIAKDCVAVESPVPGSVWKCIAAEGTFVKKGDPVVIMESMKMEIAVPAPFEGVIDDLLCAEGEHVNAGSPVASIRPKASIPAGEPS